MTDFTTRVGGFDHPMPLDAVGKAVRHLGENRAAIADAGASLHSSADLSSDWQTWPATEKSQVKNIYNAFSIKTYGADGSEDDEIAPGNGWDVLDHVRLVFVFEEPGDMVITLTNKTSLERGLADPPMDFVEGGTYESQVESKIGKANRDEMTARVMSVLDGDVDLTGKIMAKYDELFKVDHVPTAAENEAVFELQLGEYSVRQCG